MAETWRTCSSCKKAIPLAGRYYLCSVSTCQRKRTGLVFCSVSCWDAHLPFSRHREAWAIEATAPAQPDSGSTDAGRQGRSRQDPRTPSSADTRADTGVGVRLRAQSIPYDRHQVAQAATAFTPQRNRDEKMSDTTEKDVLVVVSKLKKFIKAESGLNTSDSVAAALSDVIRTVSTEAIESARKSGRKTVMDRDVIDAMQRLTRPSGLL